MRVALNNVNEFVEYSRLQNDDKIIQLNNRKMLYRKFFLGVLRNQIKLPVTIKTGHVSKRTKE